MFSHKYLALMSMGKAKTRAFHGIGQETFVGCPNKCVLDGDALAALLQNLSETVLSRIFNIPLGKVESILEKATNLPNHANM